MCAIVNRMAGFNGEVWSFEAKKALFDEWDPEKPRDYDNFNPFERNDEAAMCDTNGCFPGQSRGYQSPNRPDQSPRPLAERASRDTQPTSDSSVGSHL